MTPVTRGLEFLHPYAKTPDIGIEIITIIIIITIWTIDTIDTGGFFFVLVIILSYKVDFI